MHAAIKPTSFVLIFFAVTLAVAGQICLRRGMNTLTERTGLEGTDLLKQPITFIKEICKTWVVLLGLLFFVSSAFFWLMVLSSVPLGVAYPFVALTYIAVMVYDKIFENYPINAWNWVGVFLIVTGVIMISMRATPE
ncbi:MAG: EamA family transporter [Actinomycetota bacterium]|nr:EamA family transporter [Actinomycetota bacterium]